MRRRARARAGDRTTIAAAAGAGAWLAVGGQLGAAAGLVTFTAIQFPSLLRALRPGRSDARPATAAVLAAAAVVAVAGVGHLQLVLIVAVLAAGVTWAWPLLRRGAHRARPAVTSRRAGSSARIRGNHHGRADTIEEVPSGRIGLSRKRGGDGPSQIELCARKDQRGRIVRTAERRHVHSRWRVIGGATPCPLNDDKRHWRLRTAGRATRG